MKAFIKLVLMEELGVWREEVTVKEGLGKY